MHYYFFTVSRMWQHTAAKLYVSLFRYQIFMAGWYTLIIDTVNKLFSYLLHSLFISDSVLNRFIYLFRALSLFRGILSNFRYRVIIIFINGYIIFTNYICKSLLLCVWFVLNQSISNIVNKHKFQMWYIF